MYIITQKKEQMWI